MNLDREAFSYLLESPELFVPRTQAAALKAVEGGFLPEAAFIHKGVNVRPIFEEPYDLLELERLLAKTDLDLDTVLLLMRVFENLIKDPDKELALFAAESINALEVRWVHRIQGLKKLVENGAGREKALELVRAYFELGMMNSSRLVLKVFYLNEAQHALTKVWEETGPRQEDLALLVRCHLEKGEAKEAEAAISPFLEADPQNPELFYLMAQVKFFQRDYLQVLTLLAFLNSGNLLPEAKKIYQFWIGEGEHA